MKKKQFDSLTHQIPYYYYHKGVCLLSDGTMFAGLRLNGIDTYSMTGEQVVAIKSKLKNVFEGLPVGYVIQFYHDYHSNNDENIELIKQQLKSKHPISSVFKEFYIDKLKNDTELKNVDLYVFIICKNQKQIADFHHFIKRFAEKFTFNQANKSRFNAKENNLIQLYEEKSKELLDAVNKVRDGFSNSMQLVTELIDEATLTSLIYKLLNPAKNKVKAKPRYDNINQHKNYFYNFITMREQLTHTHVEEYSDRLLMDNTLVRVLTLKMPSRFTQEIDSDVILNSINFPICWSFNYTILDNSKVNAKLEAKQRRKYAFAVSSENPNIAATVSKTEIEQALADQKIDNFSWYECSLSFLVYADSIEELNKRSSKLISIFRDFQEAVLVEEKYAQMNYFLASLPGCAHLNDRKFLFTSSNVSDLVPISAPPIGTRSLACYFQTHRNTLFRFSIFSSEFNNYNQVVIGKTGSGKSFIVNSILNLSLMSVDHPRVMILDLGGSFKKITKLWGGEYMTIDLDQPDCGLNPIPPHSNIKNGRHLVMGLIDFTVQLILLMMGIDATERLHARVIRKALFSTYDRVKNDDPILEDLHKTLLNYSKISADKEDNVLARYMAKLLEDYIGNGPYSKLFNRKSTLSFDSDFFCFDFKCANQNPHIREIATYVVGGYFTRKLTENREKKHIIIDEFATTMKHQTGATLCEMIAKNNRKHGGSLTCISQELNDFLINPAAQTVYQQSIYKWFLKLDDNLNAFKDHLKLTSSDVHIINNLHTEKGSHSEAYLVYDKKKALIVLRPDPLNYWSCTTDAKDLLMYEAYCRHYTAHAMIDILKKLAEKYPKGVQDSDFDHDEILIGNLNEKETEVACEPS